MADDLVVEPVDGGFRVIGEVDFFNADDLFAALDGIDGPSFFCDLAGLSFIDSAGLHALLRIKGSHRGCRFINASDSVRRILEITGLLDVLLES